MIKQRQRERFLSLLDEADLLMRSDFQRAYSRLVQAERYVNDAQTRREFGRLIPPFNRRAGEAFAEADRALASGDARTGIDLLRSLSGMRLLEIAPKAEARLEEVSGIPQYRTALLEANAKWAWEESVEPILARAHELLEEDYCDEVDPYEVAMVLEVEDRIALVVALKKVVDEFKETAPGDRASELIERLSEDKDLIAAAEKAGTDRNIALEYQQAAVLARSGSKEEAIKRFEAMLASGVPDEWREMIERELRALGREKGR